MITWKLKSGYGTVITGYLNEIIPIAIVEYDGLRSREGNEEPWKLRYLLPGLVQPKENFETKEKAKAEAERILLIWLGYAGLKSKDKS